MTADFDAVTATIPYIETSDGEVRFSADPALQTFVVEPHEMQVRNARLLPNPPTLDLEGFTLARHASRIVAERIDDLIAENSRPSDVTGEASAAYLAEVAPLVQDLSGAREVIAQHGFLTMRFSARSAVQAWMSTAAMAHLDFAPSEVARQLGQTLEIGGKSVDPYGRLKVIQTWRVTTPPPQDRPLAICDARSVSPASSVAMEFLGPVGGRNASLKSRGCLYEPGHLWYFYPDMTPEELLVFKGFDSAVPDAMSALHTAFDDATRTDAVPRGSIECRFFALYD